MGTGDQGGQHHRAMRIAATLKREAGRALLAVFVAGATTARADPVADFYKGKEITIHVGFGAGGGYDTTARLFARYFQQADPWQSFNRGAERARCGLDGCGQLAVQHLAKGRHSARRVRVIDGARAAVRQQGGDL